MGGARRRDDEAALRSTWTNDLVAAAAEPGPVPASDARYRIDGELGHGGVGRVLCAYDRQLGRAVALKVPLDAHRAEAERRFLREALVTARLQHPAIVPVYEAGHLADGAPFYAMKLVEGRTLRALIEDAGALDARLTLLPAALRVCEAIAYAHEQGVVHRDIKPSNVVCGAHGETVVLDWGLARARGEPEDDAPAAAADLRTDDGLTRTGAVLGTPAYMPPEQAAGRPVDERGDVYALGALLFHLVAGSPPYAGRADTLAAVLREPPTPLEALAPDAPEDLLAIVRRAMARDPAQRYPAAAALAADLGAFLAGRLVGAHRYSLGQLLRRWVRRHRLVLAVAASLVLVSALLLALSVRRIAIERTEARRALAQAEEKERQRLLAEAAKAAAEAAKVEEEEKKRSAEAEVTRKAGELAQSYEELKRALARLQQQNERAEAASRLAERAAAEAERQRRSAEEANRKLAERNRALEDKLKKLSTTLK